MFDLCAQKSGNLVTTRVLPSTGTKKTPPPGPRRPKDPRRKERGESTGSKIMFSLSSVAFFLNARSGFLRFFNLYDKS